MPQKILRLILGDQLNPQHSWFSEKNPEVLYLMMEMRQETDYVLHHAQKILAFFGAMRAFARELQEKGHRVEYLKIGDPQNRQSLPENLDHYVRDIQPQALEYLEPDEYRLDVQLKVWAARQNFSVRCLSAEHFLTERAVLSKMFPGNKPHIMEFFYRNIRRKYACMVDAEGKPWGGRWNFDAENRQFFRGGWAVPEPWISGADLQEVWKDVEAGGCRWFGEVKTRDLPFPVSRKEALAMLQHFVREGLPLFGTFQDSMNAGHPLLWHSRLSFALNVKMLHPMEVVRAAVEAHIHNPAQYPLAQVEGFVRQIIGWREYVRGVYWKYMPQFAQDNYFEHRRPLPSWFWSGKTRMNCLRHCIGDSLKHAYAHHIQRLMVTGNFCLLAGVDPAEVDRWYLGIYADAVEWVQLPNTRGMSQFADGGRTATKPYVSSAAYIRKMSDYCQNCVYDPQDRLGPKACPFNSLYWNFFMQNAEKLRKNPRLSIAFRQLDQMPAALRTDLAKKAEETLENIEHL